MADFAIRRAEAADRPVLLQNVLAMNRFEDAIAGNRATGAEDAAATLDEVLARVAESQGLPLVAAADGLVVGHLFLTYETAPAYIRADMRRHAYVADAFVQEAWRGQGAFRAMLAVAEDHARQAGIRTLLIGVLCGNDRAERIYRRAGFRPYSMELMREILPE